MNLYTIETGFFKLDGGAMFGVVPKTIWNKINPADENKLLVFFDKRENSSAPKIATNCMITMVIISCDDSSLSSSDAK